MDEQLAATMKQGARATWASGDFDEIARLIRSVGPRLVERLDVRADEDVLDIAAGTGNAAIPAAERGARVIASDLTPELFEAGRRNAAEADVAVAWLEADAEALPFDDASFDAVLSTFGIMFAPRHEVAAAEAARVLRPGGRFGFCCWKPEGRIGQIFMTVAAHMPPPPDGFVPPPLWGEREYVTGLFDGTGIELEFHDEDAAFEFDSPESAVALLASRFGPIVKAREALEPEGSWVALRDDLVALHDRESERTPRGISYRGEYLTTIGRKPG